ncbi:restriction endonuclease subunit S [Pararhodobacter aggregans]|uniref:restriction endonuclease subunit S n=1 Tax=Pararhodobacter aggregans TaxID=404875 RepID=UPI003A8CC982
MSLETVRLETLAAEGRYSLIGGPFGSKLTSKDYVAEGIPVIRGSNMNGGRYLDETDFVFVSEQKMREDLFGNLAHPGDVVFTQRGTLGQVALIPSEARTDTYVISQSQMKLTVDPEKADPRFIYYYFSSSEAQRRILNQNSSSGVPHINLTALRNFPVPKLPVSTQAAIADILSAYDDLIETNRRRIALLEEAARLLYREWFIHFRFPGHEHVPFTDGLPNGWERRTFGEIAELKYGKALKQENRVEGPFPVYGSSGIVGTHQAGLVEGPTVIVGRKGNVGSIFWSPVDFWPIDTVYFIPKEQADFWLYLALPSVGFQNTAAGVPGLNRDFAYSRKVIHPAARLRRLFNEAVEPMFEQRTTLETYNHKLAQARDLLLPRLMNGEIAV